MKPLVLASLLAVASLAPSAHASQNISANVYDSRAALSAQTAELATVVATRPVEIQNTGTNAGTYIGAVTGGVGAYALTHGSTSYAARGLGGVLGGVVGGAVGQSIGNRAGPHRAVQIFVQRYMSNGRPYSQLTSVVEADDQGIRPGDRVLLVRGRNGFSVVRTDAPQQVYATGGGSDAVEGEEQP